MDNLKIEVEETKTYWQRMRKGLLWPIIISTCVLLELPFIDIYNQRPIDIPIVIWIYYIIWLIYLTSFCDGVYASYIHYIEITDNRVHIVGTKRNRRFEINDSIEKLTFKPSGGISLIGNGTIKITYLGNVIRQNDKWSWRKEKAFTQLLDYLEKRKLLTSIFRLFP